MFHGSHESPIGSLRRHISTWKKRANPAMTNADIADEIVKAHERIGGPARTGFHFRNTGNTYNDMKANLARIQRWLDDESDEDNLLSANFLPSVVAALPLDLKISFWNEFVSSDGLCVTGIESGDGEFRVSDLTAVMKEDSEAHQACAVVIGNPNDIHALRNAEKELTEAIETKKRAKVLVGAMIRARSLGSRLIRPFLREGAKQ